jgi:hypothetical protein
MSIELMYMLDFQALDRFSTMVVVDLKRYGYDLYRV